MKPTGIILSYFDVTDEFRKKFLTIKHHVEGNEELLAINLSGSYTPQQALSAAGWHLMSAQKRHERTKSGE